MEITIQKVTPKESKAGATYYRVNDKFTLHEKDIARTLEDNIGKTFDLEVVTSDDGKWHNIRKINAEIKGPDIGKSEIITQRPAEPKLKENFPISMKVAFAKDLFICMDEVGKNNKRTAVEIMDVACALINQATGHFQ